MPTPDKLLECTPKLPRSAETLCVQTSPNPEFAQASNNYAHFMLAQLIPLLGGLALAGTHNPDRLWTAKLLVAPGQNRMTAFWYATKVSELLRTVCRAAPPRNRTVITELHPHNQLQPLRISKGWEPYGCTTMAAVSVPMYEMCRPSLLANHSLWSAGARLLH